MHAGSKELTEATRYLQLKGVRAEVGIILGTGLGDEFVKQITSPQVIPYNSIPFFPVSTVSGHKGQFVFGNIGKKKVVAMQGRIHYYEGYSMEHVTFPVRVMQSLGVATLLISNAAGNLNPQWKHGELMLIEDHIHTIPANPLRGLSKKEKGTLFLDQTTPYNPILNEMLSKIAKENKVKLRKGVYVSNMGPALETKAEYKYLRWLGGDAVGMSTVPEVLMGNYLGIKCCAVSVLTNEASEEGAKPISLEDVIAVASKSSKKLTALFTKLINDL